MWVDAYDKVLIDTWINDMVLFTCECGEKIRIFTGDGEFNCECGRAYKQYTSFKMEEPISTEREQVFLRMKNAQDAFKEAVDAFVEATKELEKRLNERKGCDCGCS